MNDLYLDKIKSILEIHLKADWKTQRGSIVLLLKELARRLLLWKREIEQKGIPVSNRVLFDVAFMITGNSVASSPVEELAPRNEELVFSNFDHLMFRFYINWLIHEDEINKLGYDLPAPYEPYLEIIKRGGNCFKYEQGRFEVYPYIGIQVFPEEDYIKEVPFYENEEDLALANRTFFINQK